MGVRTRSRGHTDFSRTLSPERTKRPVLLSWPLEGMGQRQGGGGESTPFYVLKTRLWLMKEPHCPGLQREGSGFHPHPQSPSQLYSLERCMVYWDAPTEYKERDANSNFCPTENM